MATEVYESASFESLWSHFARGLAEPQRRPLAPDLVVVPGSGWESYFTRRLVTDRGCWAHFQFMTLGHWFTATLNQFLGPEQAPDRDVESLTWMIAARLEPLLEDPSFAPVRDYLQTDGEAGRVERLVDLSRSIAALFDEYMLLRPELIAAWEAGTDWGGGDTAPPHAEWQRKLWSTLGAEFSLQSLQAAVERLAEVIETRQAELPERVSVWICGGVPPAHLEFLEVLGRHSQIRAYILTPSHHYWADMERRRDVMRRLRDSDLALREFCEQEHLELLHPLLASLGQLSRDRQLLLLDREAELWQQRDVDESTPETATPSALLDMLQLEIHSAREPEPANRRGDTSLSIHSCHGPMREVEVLRDQIRDAFEADPALRAEDVVVLCPDLETYAPLIQAVFEASGHRLAGRLPYHIAGRSPRRTRPVIAAYFQLLEALRGRGTASQLLDLLNVPAIAEVFGLDEQDVQTFGQWVRDSGVRWGLDAEHRRDEGLPESELNTWQFGLDRLLMGYAMPPGGEQLIGSVVALDRVEGLTGQTLGKLWSFVTRLRQWRDEVHSERSWREWRQPLCQIAEQMLATRDDQAAIQRILDLIDRSVTVAADNGFEQPVPFSLVVRELTRQDDQAAGGAAFRLGGITFCEMAAMRSLPFPVIGLLGLSDGVYPRADYAIGFDLTAHVPRRGDRSSRLEDKHLFLEALLAAGQRLIITYQGQSLNDQRRRPPAVVVEELIDALDQPAYGATEGSQPSLRTQLVVEHPLQAFSPTYFAPREDPRLFSYDTTQLEAAKALTGLAQPLPVFASHPLPKEEDLDEIHVRDLRRLVKDPWCLLLKRVGADLPDEHDAQHDREPLALNSLEQWHVGQRWIERRLRGDSPEAIAQWLRCSGSLPGGALGDRTLERIGEKADAVVAAAQEECVTGAESALAIRLSIAGVQVAGAVDDVAEGGIRRATYSKLGGKRLPQLWLDHLLMVASREDATLTTLLVGRCDKDPTLLIPAVEPACARTWLQELVELYRLARRVPLPFFDAAAGALIDEALAGKLDLERELENDGAGLVYRARHTFDNRRHGTAPADSPSVRAAFAGRDPFALTCAEIPGLEDESSTPLFVHLFAAICGPMLEAMQKKEAGTAS